MVGLDEWFVFGQRPLESNVGVDVTVGEMMNDLPNRPVAIQQVELDAGNPVEQLTKLRGYSSDLRNRLVSGILIRLHRQWRKTDRVKRALAALANFDFGLMMGTMCRLFAPNVRLEKSGLRKSIDTQVGN